MPNRIIKQSAFESEKISALSDFDFRLWVGLITQADDAGRGDARPAILKGRIFPLRDRVTAKDIEASLLRLSAGSCISLYKVGGKSYYQFTTWAKHQRVYNVKSRVPGPEEADEDETANLPQPAATCGNLPQPAASCRLNLNPNTNPNLYLNPKKRANAREGERIESVFKAFCEKMQADDCLYQALCAFAEMRKAIKKPITSEHAAELLLKKLEEFKRDEWIPVIEQSILNSWQGLFPLKGGDSMKKGGSQRHWDAPSPAMLDAVKQMLEEDESADG